MTPTEKTTLALTALTSFIMFGGGAYLTAASNTPPTWTQIVSAVVTGLVAAAKAVQDLRTPAPGVPHD